MAKIYRRPGLLLMVRSTITESGCGEERVHFCLMAYSHNPSWREGRTGTQGSNEAKAVNEWFFRGLFSIAYSTCVFEVFCGLVVFMTTLCIPGCPGAHHVDQAGLELKDPPTPTWSAGIQGMNHQLTFAFLYNSGPQAQAGHYSSELGPPQENVLQAWLQGNLMQTFFFNWVSLFPEDLYLFTTDQNLISTVCKGLSSLTWVSWIWFPGSSRN